VVEKKPDLAGRKDGLAEGKGTSVEIQRHTPSSGRNLRSVTKEKAAEI